jgi:transcriptional regulator of NAD metabolism
MLKEERCTAILQRLSTSSKAISATSLAKEFSVSRQVIVQDIALLRAKNITIIATARGYLLPTNQTFQREIEVFHTDEGIGDELTTIVDLGGQIIDVFVKHRSYGRIRVELMIKSRRDVQKFLEDMASGKSRPLKHLTAECHFHTIQAESNEILDDIVKELQYKGYILDV